MRQRLGAYMSRKNKVWISKRTLNLKKNFYNIKTSKIFRNDLRTVGYRFKHIKLKLKRLNLFKKIRAGNYFWRFVSKRAQKLFKIHI